MTTYDVVINGGGPVGMGLAIELGQRGLRTAVVERHIEPQPIPKGQNLTQRSCEHFAAWGCLDALRTAHPIPADSGIGGMTAYGTLLSDHTYDWLNRAAVTQHYYTANARLPQYATERVLRARAGALDCVDILYGAQGVALTQDDAGARLTIDTPDGRRDLQARFVVGCDGSRSFVRIAAGIPETRRDHDRLMALVVFTSEELHDLLRRYPGKAFYNVLNPDLDGYWLFFGRVDHGRSWFFHAPVPQGTTTDNFDFTAYLHRAVGRPFALRLDHVGLWDLRIAIADTYRAGRVFLAGDAAHSHPPYGGYGVNTGLEDARNLGWKLAATLQGWGGAGLLDSYDAERRPVFVSTARDFIERFIEDDRAFLAAHRPGDPDFDRKWSTRNLDADEVAAFEPNYEGSPLIGGDGTPSARGNHTFRARAGHHLPPADLGDGRTAQGSLGSGFTLLSLGGDAELAKGFQAAADATATPLTLVQAGPAAAAVYGASTILVRPDQYIAWAGDRTDARATLDRARGSGA